jgi:ABC-type multidrug transport system permease subunit
MLKQILAVIRKDLKQAKRDPRFLAPSLIVPFVLLSVYVILWTSIGGGESFACGLVVEDQSTEAEEMVDILANMVSTTNHTWFKTARYSLEEATQLFESNQLIAFIIIPEGFGYNISINTKAKIILHLNNYNDDVVKNYIHRIEAAVLSFNQGATYPEFTQSNATVALEETLALVDTPSNIDYMASASMILSVTVCAIAGQALNTASEYESKAIYDTLNSPTPRLALIIGKTLAAIPRSFLSIIIAGPVIAITIGIFPVGNVFILFSILLMTIIGLVPLGELIGILTKKREQALLVSVLITIVGFFMGGGLAPILLLPVQVRIPALIMPTTYGIVMWTRVFFYDTILGLWSSFMALGVIWFIGTALVTFLTNKEVEQL